MKTPPAIHPLFHLPGLLGAQIDEHRRTVPSWSAPAALESFPAGDSHALRIDHDAWRFYQHAHLLPLRRSNGDSQTKRRRQPSEEMIPPWQYPEKPHPLWGQFPISLLLGDEDEVSMNVINQRGPRLNNTTHKPPPVHPRIFFTWLQSPHALRGGEVELEHAHFDFSGHSEADRRRCSTFRHASLLQGLAALLLEDAKIALGPRRPAHFYARRECVRHHAMVWAGDTHHYFKPGPRHPHPSHVRDMPQEVAGLLFRRLPALPYCGNDPAGESPRDSWGKFPPADPQWRCLVAASKDLKQVTLKNYNAIVVLNQDGTLSLLDSAGKPLGQAEDALFPAPYAAVRMQLMLKLLADLQRYFS